MGTVAPCSACSVEVTVMFGQVQLELVSQFEATLARDADEAVVVKAVNGVAKFEHVKCGSDCTVTVTLPDAQRLRCAGVPVLTKTKAVTRDDGKFIFTLVSRPSLTVILYGDAGRTQRLEGIRVKAKPAGDPVSRVTGANGAEFGYLDAGDYELSLELDDRQRRCFKPFTEAVALANDRHTVVERVLDPVAVLKVAVARQDEEDLAGNVVITVRQTLAEAGVTGTVNAGGAEHTFRDLDPGDYFIGVAAQDQAESAFRIGRTISRLDADQHVVRDGGRDEKVSVPAAHETTVSFVLAPPYRRIQFIGYYIYTGGPYKGIDDLWVQGSYQAAAEADIAGRCTLMRNAIGQARTNARIDADPETLKLFMAPELYFRGRYGGHPIDTIAGAGNTPGIVEQLQAETLTAGYEDWLFVYGTAVGYRGSVEQYLVTSLVTAGAEIWLDCSQNVRTDQRWSLVVTPPGAQAFTVIPTEMQTRKELSDGRQRVSLAVNDFALPDGATLELSHDATVEQAELYGKWAEVTFTCRKAPAVNWEVRQGDGVVGRIGRFRSNGDAHTCIVGIPSGGSFDPAESAILAKPGRYEENEWFNIALIQKGGPAVPVTAGGGKAIKEALVYKEYASPIDFLDTSADTNDDTVLLHDSNVKPIPTEGAEGSKFHNAPAASSEVNESGLGGGSVLTIDGVDFGIEVCFDHSVGRLDNWYQSHAAAGDPRMQVHLIPSAGMTIRNRPGVANGWIFNVDNMHCVLEQNDGQVPPTRPPPAACTALDDPGLDVAEYFNAGILIDPTNPLGFIDHNHGYIVVYAPGDLPGRQTVD